MRSIGLLLGVHIQQAKQEAAHDAGRVLSGLLLLVVALVFVLFAAVLGELAAVYAVERALRAKGVGWGEALLIVSGANALVALLLVARGRAKLRKPFLEQTRSLLRNTVTTLTDK